MQKTLKIEKNIAHIDDITSHIKFFVYILIIDQLFDLVWQDGYTLRQTAGVTIGEDGSGGGWVDFATAQACHSN
jgi:hypothetical protein